MFNVTKAQKEIGYWVSDKCYLHKQLKSNLYILKIQEVINSVKSCKEGIIVFCYKANLERGITFVKSNNKGMIWLNLKTYLNTERDKRYGLVLSAKG